MVDIRATNTYVIWTLLLEGLGWNGIGGGSTNTNSACLNNSTRWTCSTTKPPTGPCPFIYYYCYYDCARLIRAVSRLSHLEYWYPLSLVFKMSARVSKESTRANPHMDLDPKYDNYDFPTTAPETQSGHPGHTTKEQDAQVHQLRAMLEQAGYTERLDTLTLLRFLRARKFNVQLAHDMYGRCPKISIFAN